MNQKNRSTDNENSPRNTKKKRFFILIIGGIIAIFLLIAIILFAKKSSHKNKENQQVSEKETNPEINSPEQIPLSNEEPSGCPYLSEEAMEVANKTIYSKRELAKLKQIPQNYTIKLWKKGYHWWDILQLWDWKIPEKDIPNLKTEKRIGVINKLFVMFDPGLFELPKEEWEKRTEDDDIYVGGTKNMVVIVRKIPHGGPKINIDKGYFRAPMTRDEKQSGHYMKRVINFFLKQENINPQQYEITLLSAVGVENFTEERKVAFGRSGGKSAGSTLYLALLSAFLKKPIAKEVASTGALSLSTKRIKWGKVNGQEFSLVPGTNLPIGGLKHKVSAATERGGKWTGSWDGDNNKNYYEEKWRKLAEDYQQVVPPEIKAKMTVHFAENVAELRKLVLGGELS